MDQFISSPEFTKLWVSVCVFAITIVMFCILKKLHDTTNNIVSKWLMILAAFLLWLNTGNMILHIYFEQCPFCMWGF
jgi:hypothetical protein